MARLDHVMRYQFRSISLTPWGRCLFFNIKMQVVIGTNLGVVVPNWQFLANTQKWAMGPYHNFIPSLSPPGWKRKFVINTFPNCTVFLALNLMCRSWKRVLNLRPQHPLEKFKVQLIIFYSYFFYMFSLLREHQRQTGKMKWSAM